MEEKWKLKKEIKNRLRIEEALEISKKEAEDKTIDIERMSKELEQINISSDYALELSRSGYWKIDFKNTKNYISSERTVNLLGEDHHSDMVYSIDEWMKRISEVNPGIAVDVFEKLSNTIDKKEKNFNTIFPFKRPNDGEIIWIKAIGIIEYEDGKPRVLYGVNQDITQQVLNENNLKKLVVTVEQNPNAIMITNKQGIIEYVNIQFQKMMGYSKDELLGKNSTMIDLENLPENYYDQFWEILNNGGTYYGEIQNRKKDGTTFWTDTKTSPVTNEDYEIVNFVTTKSDLTQKRLDIIYLKETQKKINTALDVAKLAYWEFDFETEQLIFNDIYYKIIHNNKLNYKDNCINYKEYYNKYIIDKDREKVMGFFSEIIDYRKYDHDFSAIEIQMYDLERDFIDVSMKFVRFIEDNDGKIIKFLAINQVISEKKASDRLIKEKEATFRSIFELSNDAITIINAETYRFLDVNQAAIDMYGFSSREELISNEKIIIAPKYQENGELSKEVIVEKLNSASKEITKFNWNVKRKDGKIVETILSVSPVTFYGKHAFQGLYRDVTQENEQARIVLENEANLASIFNNSLDAIMVVDLESKRYMDCNPAAFEMYGIKDKEELIKMPPGILSPEKQSDGRLSVELLEVINENVVKDGNLKTEWLSRRIDGTTFPSHLSLSRTIYKNRSALTVTVRDITSSKNSERQEKIIVQLMRNLINTDELSVNLRLICGNIVSIFDANFSRIWVIGEEIAFENLKNDINIQVAKKGYEQYIPNNSTTTLGKNTLEKILSGDIDSFTTNDIRNDDRVSDNNDLKEFELVSYSTNIIKSPNGKIIGVIEMFSDKALSKVDYDKFSSLAVVSGQIIASSIADEEIRVAKEVAENATKAKSSFLANMSHEIRTPMNAVIGLTRLLEKTSLNTKQLDYVVKTNRAATNLLGIINDILDFSKIEAGKLEVEEIEFSLDDVLNNLSSVVALKAFEKDIEFIISKNFNLQNNLIGDPLRLGQILLNLVNNAIKFTKEGEVLVKVERQKDEQEGEISLKFSVHDSGIGLTREQKSSLFKAFGQADTSTTRKYGGTGLGLSISKSLVNMMDGTIGVESEIGVGSVFYFNIKLSIGDINEVRQLVMPGKLYNLKALIVDDNFAAREVAQQYLSGFGITSVLVEDGFKAIEIIDESFDLLIIDWKMPGLNGVETWKKIKEKLKDKVPNVIMQTAHAKDEVIKSAGEVGISTILMKPIAQSTLFNCIMDVYGEELILNGSTNNDVFVDGFDLVKGARILVVEDNEINQQVAKETLEYEGFYVDIAENGKIACDMFVEGIYDLILMDLQMPVMSGYEASKFLRESGYTDIPIIALSADAMVGVKEKIIEAGMNDFVSKPINLEELFVVLTKWIKHEKREKFVQSESEVITKEVNISKILLGFDHKAAIKRLGNKEKVYFQILKKYTSNYKNFMNDLRTSLLTNDKDNTKILIHTLKGVTGNIEAYRTNKLIKILEKEFKAGNNITKIDSFIKLELSIIEDLIEINNMLENNSIIDTFIEITDEELKTLLTILLNQLDGFKTTSKETFDEISQNLINKNFDNVTKLGSLIKKYEFEDAYEICKEMIEKLEVEI